MKVPKLRFCSVCHKHCRNKIYTFEGKDYCETHWRNKLEWDEQRTVVVRTIRSMSEFEEATFSASMNGNLKDEYQDWIPYIADLCGLAEYGLIHDDKKIFAHWFTRAVWAWGLKEAQ